MILKILVLIASIGQVFAASYISMGSFQDTERVFPVFIQPAGWAFAIWGLIYSLSIVYGVYQIIPRNGNATLKETRLPALLGFVGSVVWLYFSGLSGALIWLTIPTLFAMAFILTKIVLARDADDTTTTILSKNILLPYAAWTGIACWINVQAVLTEEAIVATSPINYISNSILLIGILIFTLISLKRSGYSLWYGGVMLWASIGIIASNITDGSIIFAIAATFFAALTALLITKR